MWTTRKSKKKNESEIPSISSFDYKKHKYYTDMKMKEKKNYNCATKWILNRSLNLHCCSSEEKSYVISGFEYCTSVFGSSGIVEEKNIFRYIVQEEKKSSKRSSITLQKQKLRAEKNKIKTIWGFLSQ